MYLMSFPDILTREGLFCARLFGFFPPFLPPDMVVLGLILDQERPLGGIYFYSKALYVNMAFKNILRPLQDLNMSLRDLNRPF